MTDLIAVLSLACAFSGTALAAIAAIQARPIRPQIAERQHELWLQVGKGFWALDQFFSEVKLLVEEGKLVDHDGNLTTRGYAALTNVQAGVASAHTALRDSELVNLSRAEHVAGRSNMLTMAGLLLASLAIFIQIAAKLK